MSYLFGYAAGRVRLFAIALMLCCPVLLPGIANAAHTSLQCAPKTGTVSNGGTVAVDVTDCAVNIGFAGIGPVDGPALPAHGSANLRITGSNWFADYSHNGDSATSDVFEFTDGTIAGDTVQVTITITPPTSPITVAPASLPTLTAGTPFSQTLTSAGGIAPYIYTLQSGVLPAGLSLSSGGVLSGTPTQRGGYSFSVRSTDNIGQFADKGYTGTVQNPSLSITPTSATAIQGIAFSQVLTAVGGVAPHSYLLETGSFPAGISISSAGVISGTTAAAPGSYPVTLRVTDSSTGPGSYFELESFTLTVSPPPSVSIAVAPASVSEDGATSLVYTVTRSLNLSSPTVVNISTGGTATSGIDYTGGVATVIIPGGATTATVTINPAADTTVEADETVILTVAAGTGYTIGSPSSATGTILNDDVPTASIMVAPAAVAEDGAANLVYTVSLDQAALTPTSVNFSVSGTATSGTDFAAVTSPLVIATGATIGTITVDPTADSVIEADETVSINLSAGSGYSIGVPAGATGTILNDDAPNLTINNVSLAEGNAGTSNAAFTVSLSAPAGPGGVTFDIASANGTATAGVDYVANSLTGQTIPAGSSTYMFTVLVNGDTLNEPDETYFVNVTNVVGAVIVDGQGLGTIVNDDALPSLSINDVSVVEGNAGTVNADFTVTLSAASGQNVTVNFATADGSAAAPTDYAATTGSLTFAPGETAKAISVAVNGDTTPEPDELFSVGLSGATNASIATATATGTGTITNDDVPVTLSPTTVPSAAVGVAYSQAISASGGIAPYTFAVTAGALPGNMTLSAAGALSGTPSAGGTFNFTVTATDSSSTPGPYTGSQAYTLVINAASVVLPATSLADGSLGTAYSGSLNPASGGTPPYSYLVSAGALPGGLTLAPGTGQITGTPSALGSFNFSVTATDSSTGTGPYSATQAYSITVVDQAPVANPVSVTVAYNSSANPVTLNITGGPAVSVAVATPATNGTATASGTTISYQPATGYAGSDSFTYTATNTGGTSAAATVTVTVSDPVITVTPSGGFAATVGVAYTQTFTWSGGASPYSGFQITNLPAGVSISATTADSATISGTPTAAGSFSLNAMATDSSSGSGPFTGGDTFILVVSAPTLSLAPAATGFNANYAMPFSQTFIASSGVGPYSYAVSGLLPAGVSLAGDTLSGSPTEPGSFNFTITATDTGSTGTGSPFTVAVDYTLDVTAPTIVIDPASLPDAVTGLAYSEVISASGGVAPYTFAVTAGSLPGGVTLATDGTLSGMPAAPGTFNFDVEATDGNAQIASRAYVIVVQVPPLTFVSTALADGTVAFAYSQTLSATDGLPPYQFAVTTGTLPPGLTLDPSGVLSGVPSTPGVFAFSVTVTDSNTPPDSVSADFIIRINPPAIDLPTLSNLGLLILLILTGLIGVTQLRRSRA